MFLFSIGIVALIAGSFGVINTMTTSISERTREIGTLKAIGAKDGQILKIFMSEAVILGVVGGAIGVSTGILFSIFLPLLSGGLSGLSLPGLGGGLGRRILVGGQGGVSIAPAILPSTILLCFSLGLVVGVLAGLYPSWRAARMKPVEALRHV
jgi:putative ABC transport system permease protein